MTEEELKAVEGKDPTTTSTEEANLVLFLAEGGRGRLRDLIAHALDLSYAEGVKSANMVQSPVLKSIEEVEEWLKGIFGPGFGYPKVLCPVVLVADKGTREVEVVPYYKFQSARYTIVDEKGGDV